MALSKDYKSNPHRSSLNEVRKFLSYNEKTGEFVWRMSKGRAKAGKTAGVVGIFNGRKYISIGFSGRLYLAHRLAWFYKTGTWPGEVDHKDGNGLNNSWANLREASRSQNNANAIRKRNVLGKGVTLGWGGRFKAHIQFNGKGYYLGTFDSKEEARAAYLKAAIENFGEFARA